MTKKWIWCLFCLLLLGHGAEAQYFLTGQDAARTKWKQLSTTHFRLIFPEAYAGRAQQVARLLEATYPAINAGLGARAVHTDVVLHNQNSISNALVAWAPRRMDFFHTPPQDGYAQDWLRQLVLHELRHVAQMSRLETGFGRAVRYAFGQQATGAMAGLFLPGWFMEGDAVWTETALSSAGRGRTPLFSAGLKAQLAEKGKYSYEKAWFGSYRDFTPDIYELGYHLVAYNKLKYDGQIWEKAVGLSATRPWLIYPFSTSLRRQTGMGVGKLYTATMDSLAAYWKSTGYDSLTTIRQISPKRKAYSNYRYPQPTPHGIVAFRTSFDDISRIVLLDSLGEHVLFTPFYIFPEGFSAKNHWVVWNEYQPDLRWSNRAYSVIKLGGILTGKVRQISHRSYYYAPDLNHAGNIIAVSEVKPDGSSAIVLLDAETGTKLNEYAGEKYFLHQPKWLADDEHIAFLATGDKGKSLWLLNTRTMHAVQYSPFTSTDFHLSSAGDGVVFLHGAWDERNEAYVFDFATQQLSRLTQTAHAAADPAWDQSVNKLVFANYTSDGWMIAASEINPNKATKQSFVEPEHNRLLGMQLPDHRFTIEKAELPDTTYAVKPYHRALNLFRLHSWAPFYVDAASQEIRPGLSLMSQNSLSTMTATLGFDYDQNEQTGKTVLQTTYYGLFPVIDAKISTGRRKGVAQMDGQTYNLRWNETNAGLQLYVPLNLTRNRWQRGLNLGTGVNMLHRVMDSEVGLNFKQDYTTAFNYNLLAYNLDRRKIRDIYPRTGQIVRLIFRHSPLDENPGEQLFTSAIIYLPGFYNHHGLRLYAALQRETAAYYTFGSYVSVPRGLSGVFGQNLEALKLDYVFPLAYPDFRIGPVLYAKRLRAALYYDFLNAAPKQYSSQGLELWADVHLIRLQAPVSMGLRLGYIMPDHRLLPEFTIGIDWNAVY